MDSRKKLVSVLIILLVTSLACGPLTLAEEVLGNVAATQNVTPTPTATPVDTTTDVWYVATDGDNSNSCTTPEDACLTIQAAVIKSTPADQIIVAEGIYPQPAYIGIGHNLTLSGAGEDLTIIDGEGDKPGIRIGSGAVVLIENLTVQNTVLGSPNSCIHAGTGSNVTLQNVTVRNCVRAGLIIDRGGVMIVNDSTVEQAVDEDTNPEFLLNGYGIWNRGEVQINNSEVINNPSYGLYNTGTATLLNSQIDNNQRYGIYQDGGSVVISGGMLTRNFIGLFVKSGVAEVADLEVDGNQQDGINVLRGGLLRAENTTISNHPGFALAVRVGGVADLTQVRIENNGTTSIATLINEGNLTATELVLENNFNFGLYNIGEGQMFLYDSEVKNQNGRAVYNQDTSSEMLVSGVLLDFNNTEDEVLYNGGTIRVINTTISNNNAFAALRSRGESELSYLTIADNRAYGLMLDHTGPYEVNNLVIARNSSGDCYDPLSAVGASVVNSMDTDGSCDVDTYTPSELGLEGLADNGGLTFTHALLEDSPARDSASGACPSIDQRGSSFTRPIGPACDQGAYEAGAVALSGELDDVPLLTTGSDTPCYSGPGPQWDLLNYFQQGTQLEIVGQGFAPGWMVAKHPTASFTNCWIPLDKINFDIPIDQLRIIAIPPRPSPFPTSTPGDRPTQAPTPCPTNINNVPEC